MKCCVPNNGFSRASRILMTTWGVALAEPSPFGEIGATGVTIGVGIILGGIWLYNLIGNISHNDYQICQILYEQCLRKNSGFGNCYDCRDECNSNRGAWPFYKCKL